MKLTKPEHIGALQLIPGVGPTIARASDRSRLSGVRETSYAHGEPDGSAT
jgi:hypothetical protein